MAALETAAAGLAVFNGVRSLFGGGGGETSVHGGWRVQGTLTGDSFSGTNTAWDQLGNQWAAGDSTHWIPATYRKIFGDTINEPVSIDITIPAGESFFWGGAARIEDQLRQYLAAWNIAPAPAVAPVVSPVAGPSSLFEGGGEGDGGTEPIIPTGSTSTPATGGGLFNWLNQFVATDPVITQPAGNETMTPPPIIPAGTAPHMAIINGQPHPATAVKPVGAVPVVLVIAAAVALLRGA